MLSLPERNDRVPDRLVFSQDVYSQDVEETSLVVHIKFSYCTPQHEVAIAD